MINAFRDLFGAYRFRLIGFVVLLILLDAMSTVWGVMPPLFGIILMIIIAVCAARHFWRHAIEEVRWENMGLDPETGEPVNPSWADERP